MCPYACYIDGLYWLLTTINNETGRRGGARHNSSTRHDSPEGINRLRKASANATCLEVAPLASKEAPQWPQGLCRLPRQSSLTTRLMGGRVPHPPKPTNSLELGREPLSSGPNKGLRLSLSVLLGPQSMATEGLPQKAGSRGSGPIIVALRRAWCSG